MLMSAAASWAWPKAASDDVVDLDEDPQTDHCPRRPGRCVQADLRLHAARSRDRLKGCSSPSAKKERLPDAPGDGPGEIHRTSSRIARGGTPAHVRWTM